LTRPPVRPFPLKFSPQPLTYYAGLLGARNPFSKKAKPSEHEIWLLNNTAFRPVNGTNAGPWQAEFVACFFQKGRKDITSTVSSIADMIGLDGSLGSDPEVRKRIEQRVRPFVQAIGPARTVEITIPNPDAQGSHKRTLGPSDSNGISSQILLTGGGDAADGKTVSCKNEAFQGLSNSLRFAGPEGWSIISDIDDTVKVTMTPDPLGLLRTTFAELPKTTEGMPEFYKMLQEQFKNPAWFYLSASPYNLYTFLEPFITKNYPSGTIILRDSSWMYFAGFLQSLTEGVQEYKTDRMRKVHSWIPNRKIICIGDSTQSDPESYAQMYKEFPGWIKAIYIRKVLDAPFMEQKNKEERFKQAFKDVPENIWRVFVKPTELAHHIEHLAGEAHLGITGALTSFFYGQGQQKSASEQPASSTPGPNPPS
jgi:Uncharacterized conserved protein (DUF2183)